MCTIYIRNICNERDNGQWWRKKMIVYMELPSRDTLTISQVVGLVVALVSQSLSLVLFFIHVTMITSTDEKNINHCICLQMKWKLQKLFSLVPLTSFLFRSCPWLPATATLLLVPPFTVTLLEFLLTSILKLLLNLEQSFSITIMKKRLTNCSNKL